MFSEVKQQLAMFTTTALSLLAALALNKAFSSLFEEGGPLYFVANYGVWVYALVVCLFAILVMVWVGRIFHVKTIKVDGELEEN